MPATSSHLPRLAILAPAILLSTVLSSDRGLAQNPDSITLQTSFIVTVDFTDGHGTESAVPFAVSTPSGNDSAAFTFRDPRNTEVIVRILDSCEFAENYFFFATSLTDLPYTITVRDNSSRGSEWTYSNSAGQRRFFGDTMSLPCPPLCAGRLPGHGAGALLGAA